MDTEIKGFLGHRASNGASVYFRYLTAAGKGRLNQIGWADEYFGECWAVALRGAKTSEPPRS